VAAEDTEQQHTATLTALVHMPPPLHTASELLHTILSVSIDWPSPPQGEYLVAGIIGPNRKSSPVCHAQAPSSIIELRE